MVATIAILLVLIFSKFFYMASFSSYFTFYLIHHFGVSVQESQLYLFVFLGAVAVGTVVGGPIGDRFGRKVVIWGSILGVLPFTVALPHVNLAWTVVLTVPIGMILASAMPAILVYAQELLPGRVGLVGGLFFGFAFGMGGLGAAILGQIADLTSIETVYRACAYLPAIGLLAAFLPRLQPASRPDPGSDDPRRRDPGSGRFVPDSVSPARVAHERGRCPHRGAIARQSPRSRGDRRAISRRSYDRPSRGRPRRAVAYPATALAGRARVWIVSNPSKFGCER